MSAASRSTSYGQTRKSTPVDRFGVWLSGRAVHRNASFDGARIADLGCGYRAAFAQTVLERCAEALLVDVSLAPELLTHPKVTAVQGGLPDAVASQPAESRDVVTCLSVLEHLTEPERMLTEIRRLLAPGGVALINVPNWRGKIALEFTAFRLGVSPAEEMDDHKRYYDPRDLWPMLVAAGFRPSGLKVYRHKLTLNTFAVCRV